eukprot:6175099-Pleurochrysis_carterae.AAC.2
MSRRGDDLPRKPLLVNVLRSRALSARPWMHRRGGSCRTRACSTLDAAMRARHVTLKSSKCKS